MGGVAALGALKMNRLNPSFVIVAVFLSCLAHWLGWEWWKGLCVACGISVLATVLKTFLRF